MTDTLLAKIDELGCSRYIEEEADETQANQDLETLAAMARAAAGVTQEDVVLADWKDSAESFAQKALRVVREAMLKTGE